MPPTIDEELDEELKELLLREALQRRDHGADAEAPSELRVLTEEIRNFASTVALAVSKPTEPVVLPVQAPIQPNMELMDTLTEMKRFSGIVTAALSKPATAFPVSPPQLAPVVHVSPPTVNLSPQVTVERPTRWRFIVTKRDPSNQGRIQEITAETF